MASIDINRLNKLERKIHEVITVAAKTEENITIKRASELCGCSMSKISKFVQKFGFRDYKQYMRFVYEDEKPPQKYSNEMARIKEFIEDFNVELIDEFVDMLNSYSKILLFGLGPTFICMQYFEYKLRIVTNKVVISVQDEVSVESLLDEDSLLIIFSVTGEFASFKNLYEIAKKKGSGSLLVLEEYNVLLLNEYDKIMFLTKTFQQESLLPYEKSRNVFFLFIEEVLQRLHKENIKNDANTE